MFLPSGASTGPTNVEVLREGGVEHVDLVLYRPQDRRRLARGSLEGHVEDPYATSWTLEISFQNIHPTSMKHGREHQQRSAIRRRNHSATKHEALEIRHDSSCSGSLQAFAATSVINSERYGCSIARAKQISLSV
jgi:hypothetical protein